MAAFLGCAATGGPADDIGTAEIALNGSLGYLDVLDVLERDGRLMNHPDAPPDTNTPIRKHVPGGVVPEMKADIGHHIRRDQHDEERDDENGARDRKRDRDRQPDEERNDIAGQERDPEQ